jgi:hypothetical protein
MDFREILYRTGQFFSGKIEHAGLGRARPSPPGISLARSWSTPLATEFQREPYELAAESILRGRYTIFAMNDIPLGFPPGWNCDPKSGKTAPLKFGKSLNYRDERLVGNVKYLWEPNRHHELVTLAQAWHLSRKLHYAAACKRMLESWIDACPYPLGPNWSSSLELGIRLVNWSFSWHLLGGEHSPLFVTAEGQRFRRRWLDSIYCHCHFIAGYLSKYSSANNHLFGEQLGLFIAATTWPVWAESTQWRETSQPMLEREALVQNAEDGVNREQGIWYHHEVADMMLLAALVGRTNGWEFSRQYWTRFENMLEFLASIMDLNGHLPAWGDSDDGVMVRFCPARDFNAYRSLLATGAVLFDRADFKVKARVFDDKSRWLLGDAAAEKFMALKDDGRKLPVRHAFAQGGYYILGADFETDREVRIVADAGPLGYLSIAAHGHADALSFTLSIAGHEFLIDPGTFAYHTDQKWRDYFRGTGAHNTLRIDGKDQSVIGGNFLWTHHARTTCHNFELSGVRQRLVASHDGYHRLSAPATHRRTWTYLPDRRLLVIDDEVATGGAHTIELHWHFGKDCEVELFADHVIVKCREAVLALHWQKGLSSSLTSANIDPPLGWISHRFDQKVPCNVLTLSQNIAGNWMGRTELRISLPPSR